MKIIEYFAGYYICEASKYGVRIINRMNRRGIKYYGLCSECGKVRFCIIKRTAKKNKDIIRLCDKTAEKGFSVDLKEKIKRPGLFIGAAICIFTLLFSGLFVWDVTLDTSGGENAERIMRVLTENGLKRGALKASVDRKRLENLVMLSCPDVSYIAINLTGNDVNVRTDERVIKQTSDNNAPCDLTAKEDGFIIRYETYKGRPVCETENVVKRGDVLITGLVETKHHGIERVHSSGRVFALVKRSYLVSVPAEYYEKTYTGNEYKTVTLKVFSLDLTVKNDIRKENCDIFESTDRVSVAGAVDLPIFVQTTLYREYKNIKIRRTEEQIKKELERLSAEQFELITDGCEVQMSDETVYEKNGVYYLYCDVWCVADIATESPISEKTEENRK